VIAINRSVVQSLAIATALALFSAQALADDVENGTRAGKVAFNTSCRTCHTMVEGDNRLGPNLHGIIGRKAGSEEYAYSPAMASSSLVWDAESLDRFIRDPQTVIPGNNMKPYGGISDAATREKIVAYLSDAGGGGDAGGDGEAE
jgi:cytochrome c